MWEVDFFCGMIHQIPPLQTSGCFTVLSGSFQWAGLHRKVGDSDIIIIHWLYVLNNTVLTIKGVNRFKSMYHTVVLFLILQHGRFLTTFIFLEVLTMSWHTLSFIPAHGWGLLQNLPFLRLVVLCYTCKYNILSLSHFPLILLYFITWSAHPSVSLIRPITFHWPSFFISVTTLSHTHGPALAGIRFLRLSWTATFIWCCRWMQYVPPKCLYLPIRVDNVIAQNINVDIFTVVSTWDLKTNR